jgi:hypothetical protein
LKLEKTFFVFFAVFIMPRGKGKNNKKDAGKRQFVASNHSAGSSLRVVVADDVFRKSVVPDLSRLKIPKNIQTQIHWFETSYQNVFTLNTTTLTEVNYSFTLSNSAISTAIVALYDQYAIFAAYVRYVPVVANLVTTQAQGYCTALDFDNTNNLSSYATLAGYSTSQQTNLFEVQERYLEPCNAPALYSGAGFSHYGQSRMWVDSANATTPHYAIRCIVNPIGTGATGSVDVFTTLVVCARNVI